jgi:hypothetical protein
MNPQLAGTLVGGALTLIGGFAATLFWRWRDGRREDRKSKRQLAGAINIVLAELAANHAIIERAVEHEQAAGELRVADHSYRQVELVLAERLPATVGQWLFEAYAPIRAGDLYRRWWYISAPLPGMQEPSSNSIDLAECARLLPVLEAAGAALRQARDRLGAQHRPQSLKGR